MTAATCIGEKPSRPTRRIYNNIGVRTRVMAGIWALQQGILAETREIPS